MSEFIETVARFAHEAVRQHNRLIGDPVQPGWDEAPEWVKESARRGVRWRLAHLDAPVEAQHEAWMAHRASQGWVYGPQKDEARKTHPSMVPFHHLPWAQRAKDAIFAAVVRVFADYAHEWEHRPAVGGRERRLRLDPMGHWPLETLEALAQRPEVPKPLRWRLEAGQLVAEVFGCGGARLKLLPHREGWALAAEENPADRRLYESFTYADAVHPHLASAVAVAEEVNRLWFRDWLAREGVDVPPPERTAGGALALRTPGESWRRHERTLEAERGGGPVCWPLEWRLHGPRLEAQVPFAPGSPWLTLAPVWGVVNDEDAILGWRVGALRGEDDEQVEQLLARLARPYFEYLGDALAVLEEYQQRWYLQWVEDREFEGW